MKRLFLLVLAVCLLLTVGCGSNDFNELAQSAVVESEPELPPEPTMAVNPLTGLETLDLGKENSRPTAIMVNNLAQAQAVQTGLNSADLVYECLVEGGISRLMAVYKDVSKAPQVGSIRSARYTYVELARGLDATYVHCGSDQVYTVPFMRNIGMDDYDLGSYSASSFRENNGLAYEHRLYTTGELLTQGFEKKGQRVTTEKTDPIFTFAAADAPVQGNTDCQSVEYAMSSSYTTTFIYDAASGTYSRNPRGSAHKDCKTGETTTTQNLFILYADSPMFDDNYHLHTVLSAGKGLYVSGGTCQEIRWEKGDTDAPLTFTDAQGNPLTVNPGRSWIAFPPTRLQSSTVITGAPSTTATPQ